MPLEKTDSKGMDVMISESMKALTEGSSVIRAMFEEGKKMASVYGKENVYDFSLGNPSVNPPLQIKEAIEEILKEEDPAMVHGYMNNAGYEDVRESIAASLNKRFDTHFNGSDILMTVGAAGGLNVIFRTLLNPLDEVIVFAPYFGEYRNYAANCKAVVVEAQTDKETFMPDLSSLEESISEKTRIVLINTPNNPTGVVYSEEVLTDIASVLRKKSEEYGAPIYLVSDEPYRELVYDGAEVPYVTKFYNNTIVGYSYSKSLSLPGERIGYLVLPDELDGAEEIKAAANVANRILGFVNAPSLMQRVIGKCPDLAVDIGVYDANRKLLYESLISYGYTCIKPQGAFYLFVKTFDVDDKEFVKAAKEKRILLVPGSSFGCPGYVRIAYCVDHSMIERSLPGFKELAEKFGGGR